MQQGRSFDARIARYRGFRDAEGRFVPFGVTDELFRRARSQGVRLLLRLDASRGRELVGTFHHRKAP